MTEHGPAAYGDRIAGVYDEWFAVPKDAEDAASFLSELAGHGPALELGIGTGRVALPLLRRGVEVRGIDASEAMVEKLREKPGGENVPVHIGDFADVGVEDEFSLTQDDQVRCFENVARHLRRDGVFAVEAFVPDMTLYDHNERVGVPDLRSNRVVLDAARHDPVNQRVAANHVAISEEGIKIYPVRLRYTWPSELDLMARVAGLCLRERWGGWRKEPFTADSGRHVSVYERG